MNEKDLMAALETLRNGGIILYPTDTVWGLGCDATNARAVERIFELKRRPDHKSMLVLMENPALLDRYVEEIPEVAWDLIDLTTTPLTIIFDRARNLAPNLVGDDGSIGIRFTRELFSAELIRRFRKPVVSTSANISGEKAPAIFAEITPEIRDGADYVVEYRRDDTTPVKPSSIIKLGSDGRIDIIRP